MTFVREGFSPQKVKLLVLPLPALEPCLPPNRNKSLVDISYQAITTLRDDDQKEAMEVIDWIGIAFAVKGE